MEPAKPPVDSSRLAQALKYLGGLDIDPVNVLRRAGLNLPTAEQVAGVPNFVGPGADIKGMMDDTREGSAAVMRGDLLGALGGYGSAAMAIPMMALPGTVAGVKKGVGVVADADNLADALKRMGIRVERKGSGLSDSQYLNVSHGENPDLRVRIADHQIPPTYERSHGVPDFEIGHGYIPETGVSGENAWLDVLDGISKRTGVTPPDDLAKLIASDKAAYQAEVAARAAQKQAASNSSAQKRANVSELVSSMPAEEREYWRQAIESTAGRKSARSRMVAAFTEKYGQQPVFDLFK